MLGVGDSPALWHEVFCVLTLAAEHTSTIRIAPTVTNPVTRHLGVLAGAAATVDELSGGRLTLGIGVGDSGVLNLGERPSSVADLGRSITALRSLLAGRTVDFDGRTVRSGWATSRPPIIVAAAGPRMLQLAGKVADGVIVSTGAVPELIEAVETHLGRGMADAAALDRSRPFERWHQYRYTVADSFEAAVHEIRTVAAAVGHHALSGDLHAKRVPPELHDAIRELGARYDPQFHCAPGDSPNALLIDDLGLTEYLVDRFIICGTPAQCAGKVMDLHTMGITKLLMATTVDPVGNMIRWGEQVSPIVARSRAGDRS
jgi:5,10-methylenetetrahydromethanopterin reductase